MTSVIGPPVRPRYRIVSLTGYTHPDTSRKPRTTWAVHDRLVQGFQVGPDYYAEGRAEAACAALEQEWENYLTLTAEGTKPLAPEDMAKRIRAPRVMRRFRRQPFRPTCPGCRRRATVAGETHCPKCGTNYYFGKKGPYAP